MEAPRVALLVVVFVLGCAACASSSSPGHSARDDDDAGVVRACVPAHASAGPALSGRYCVGLEQRVLADDTRDDPFALGERRAREVSVTLHYPVQPGSTAPPAPYGDLQTWGVLYGKALMPDLFSNAVLGEEVAKIDGGFPLVLYSPGFAKGLAETNTFMIQDLVSHGYVVAAIDHPYVSLAVRSRAGDVVRFGDGIEALALPDDPATSDQSVYAFPIVLDDLRFVLAYVLELTRSDRAWRGRIDEKRIGMFGHSYGGAAAAELVRSDPRVRAAVNYDGQYHAGVLEHGIGGPLLLIAVDGRISANPPPNDNYGYREATRTAKPGYFVEIEGAIHGMFQADLGVLLKRERGTNDPLFSGDVDADLNLELCSAYNLAFFDAYLKDAPTAALEDVARRFSGIRFGIAE